MTKYFSVRVNLAFFHTALHCEIFSRSTLFWLFREKVQKLRIFDFHNLNKKSILPISRHPKDLKISSLIFYNLFLSSIELFKVEQLSSFSQNCNIPLVPLFENWPIASKIAVYRGNHVKIDKILGNKLIHHHYCNDL